MENIVIVTGGSKGIGRGIVEAYQAKGYHVISVARTKSEKGIKNLTEIAFDLRDSLGISELIEKIFSGLNQNTTQRIVLVNNAGTLGEVGRLDNLDTENIKAAVEINTLAPLLLTSAFINQTKDWAAERKIINISSGAAQNPYHGWSIYCATKASLDMMTKVVAIEQENLLNGAKIISIYPGTVDTDMQTEIRKHSKEDFKEIERFLELKASGSLTDPAAVGVKIFEIDQQDLENGSILRDLRSL
ncbi:MAG: SDR family NAD(P)-dependent oxidoreductase [Pedobacter sp.]|nr:MAG: SDR family NAD(P)-dependent oxidoreductase [Pedobacter sp.]